MLRMINGELVKVELYLTESGELTYIEDSKLSPYLKGLNAVIDEGLIIGGGKYSVHLEIKDGEEIYTAYPIPSL